MKTWKKVVSLLLAAALVIPGVDFGTLLQVSAAGTTKQVTDQNGNLVTPEMAVSPSEATISMKVGDKKQLGVVVTPSDAVVGKVTWSSSDTAKATVSETGLVEAVSPTDGNEAVTITATATAEDGTTLTATCSIKITGSGTEPPVGDTQATSITITGPDSVGINQEIELSAIVVPSGAKQEVDWSIGAGDGNKVNIVTQSDGKLKVTGKAVGDVIVTATAKDGSGVTATKTIKVYNPAAKVAGVTVSASVNTVEVGKTITVTATVTPGDAKQDVNWTSSDNTIATVANGVVTGVKAGKVTITATSTDDETKKDSIEITVTQSTVTTPTVTGVTVSAAANTITVGGTTTVTATVAGTTTNKAVTWTSETPTIATVDDKGVVTGVAAGEATIKATSVADPTKSGTVKITVQAAAKPPIQSVAVTGITLTPATESVVAGGTVKLTATVAPDNATNKGVNWTSSNNAWATVANGVVTTTAAGAGHTVTITAISAEDANIKATATITIKAPVVAKVKVTRVTVGVKKGSKKTVNAGGKVNLTVTVKPANATNKKVTWSIAQKDKKYATVSQTGVVTTKKAGAGHKVIVTATAKDGSKKKGTITITIKKVAVKKIAIKGSKSVKAGKKVTLKVNVTPKNATNTAVTWSIDKKYKRYASVNKKGVVTTKKAGKGKTIKVTATSKDNKKKKATISIKIKK